MCSPRQASLDGRDCLPQQRQGTHGVAREQRPHTFASGPERRLNRRCRLATLFAIRLAQGTQRADRGDTRENREQLLGDARGNRNTRSALAVLDSMDTRGRTATSIRVGDQALYYAQLGAVDSALSRLSIAVHTKDPTPDESINAPALALVHQDARWAALIQEYRGR